MASKRDLKKDINFLTEEIIEACFLHQYFKRNQEEEKQRIDVLINETISLRNQLLYQINHADDNMDGKSSKQYFGDILNQMMDKADEVFEKLGQLEV